MTNPANHLAVGQEVKDKRKKAVQTVYDAVAISLGPRSAFAGIDYGFEKKVLKDGVSIARVILLEDLVENFFASIIVEASKKQVVSCGDGTTCVIILAYAIINEATKLIEAGVSPMSLREGLEQGVEKVIKEIEKSSIPIKTLDQKKQIATISASDKDLGELVADIMEKVGGHGLITIEESKNSETEIEHQEGMQFDKGYASPYFVTNAETLEASIIDPSILVTDKRLVPQEIMPLLEDIAKKGKSLVIIGPPIMETMRDFLIVNKMQGKIRALYVNAPMFGDKQNAMLQDIAILTGGRFISEEKGDKPEDIKFEDLGKARRVTSFSDSTEIVGGKGDKKLIDQRVKAIKSQISDTESEFDKDKLKERFAKLTGGVAVINVGGQTEIEMKERKERAIDAVAALRAAIESGIVPGGETIYLSALHTLKEDSYANTILRNALKEPFKILMENAGMDAGQMNERLIKEPLGSGIDVTDGKVKDMVKEGIIDPTAVSVNALRNAVSVAIQALLTKVVIVPIPERTVTK